MKSQLLKAARHLGLKNADLTVVVVGDAMMSELHGRFCGIVGTTDALTFDMSEPRSTGKNRGNGVEGEVYVCLDEARRRAAEIGHAVRRELLLYAVHGLLHLMGHDDHDPDGYRRMHAQEDRLLEAIGVGAAFAKRGPGGAA